MKIVHVDPQASGTVLYLERDDGSVIGHALPTGVLEHRVGEWDLPADVDPIDLILVETHYSDIAGHLTPYAEDFDAERARLLAEVRKHRDKTQWGTATASTETNALSPVLLKKAGLSKDTVKRHCHLPPGISDDVTESARRQRRHNRENMQPRSELQAVAELQRTRDDLAKSMGHRAQLLLAEDHVSDKQSDRKQRPELNAGLAPVDSVQSRSGSGAFRVEW
jgi:hypothetical protein